MTGNRTAGLVTRRATIRGLIGAAGGLMLASKMPTTAEAEELAGHASYCGAPYGPMHRFLYSISDDPVFCDYVVWRESNWIPSATNPYSGAAGLAQFMPQTWAWGEELWGIYGSPYDWQTALLMMAAFVADGQYYHWDASSNNAPRGLAVPAAHAHDLGREVSGG